MKYTLITILCCLLAQTGKSQYISFRHFTTDDGLSHNSSMSIYQDERGFVWFGTRDGANLYNGKEIKQYKHLKNNPNSLSYNEIREITGDGKGTVYFLTNNQGISAYNIKKDLFTNIVPQKISAIYFKTELFFAKDSRLYKYKKDSIQLIYQLPSKKAIITNLHQSNDSLFIGTSNEGLYLLKNKRDLSHIIPEGHIFDLFEDSSGDIWVSSYDGGGLCVLSGGKITNMKTSPNDLSSISSNQVHRCCEDQNGDIWIGTFDGLNKYDKRTKQFTRYYKKEEKNSLTASSIFGLMCDHQGTIWAGTYYGGVNFFNPSKQIYHEYHVSSNESEGLSSPTIGKIIEDKHQNIWMCTEGAGILKYNLSTRRFKAYKHDSITNSMSHNNAKAIYYDAPNDVLWIGTHLGGLNKLDIKNNQFTHYTHQKNDSSSLPSTVIADIIPLDNQLIVAAVNGIIIFDPQTGKCKPLFNNKEYHSRTLYSKDLELDHRRVLWIANHSNGVSAYHFDTQKLNHYQYDPLISNGISSNNINSIYEDSQGRLWFCTNEHGLDLYHYETNDFENFDMQKNGLSSNVIYAVCELSKDQLLITTNNGFSILDYPNKRFTNYDKSKKMPLSSINENSLYKTSHGEIFIGGTDGMISFFPKNINHKPRAYNILPFRLTVNGQEVNVGDSTHILSEDLTTTQEIALSPQYTIFTLEYTSTDFLPIDKEGMMYKLEGFSDKWVNMHDNNAVTYTNLNPGTYVLRVKSTNEQNKLVRESSIKIVIRPPFYQTGWAYLIYILCASALIYLLLRTYNNRIKLQESLKYEKKQTEETERMNQSKLRFFTNISHEFRTPLTIIIGQIEMLLQSQTVGSSLYNPVLKIRKNCLQLQSLITELLDFRKLEQGYMSLKASEHNLTKDIYEHYLSFQEYAIQKQITYKFIKFSDEIQVWYDSKLLQKVMNNLIINAFKHTPPKGKITITVRKKNSEAVIEVTDNGEGIESKDIDKIFDRFYQVDSGKSTSYMSTGIGLSLAKGIVELHHGKLEVYSEPGIETTFSIRLQIGKEHFNAEEINESPQKDSQASIDLPKQELAFFTPQEESTNQVSEPKTKGTKILIIEDNESVRELLFNLFNPYYIVITACDGQEGLDKVKSEQPDLIVSDIVMPQLSGIELCKILKEDIETCHIPIVLLTAKTAIEHNIEGFKTGADDYITKPFSVELLLSRCNNLVNSRIMLQEKFSKQPQSTHKMLAHNTLDKEFIDNAIKVIEKHIEDVDFNMDDFARETGIARTKLFTKLKAITGQTPAEFMLTIRLQKSAILLKNHPEFNISEIADQLGFSSPRYFRKCFKDKYHVTPQEYRREEGSGSMEEEKE